MRLFLSVSLVLGALAKKNKPAPDTCHMPDGLLMEKQDQRLVGGDAFDFFMCFKCSQEEKSEAGCMEKKDLTDACQCTQLCIDQPGCRYWEFDHNTNCCYFKKTEGAVVAKDGHSWGHVTSDSVKGCEFPFTYAASAGFCSSPFPLKIDDGANLWCPWPTVVPIMCESALDESLCKTVNMLVAGGCMWDTDNDWCSPPSGQRFDRLCKNSEPSFHTRQQTYGCPKPLRYSEHEHSSHTERYCLNPLPYTNSTGLGMCEDYSRPETDWLSTRGYPECDDEIERIIKLTEEETMDEQYIGLDFLETSGCEEQIYLSTEAGGNICPGLGLAQDASCPFPFYVDQNSGICKPAMPIKTQFGDMICPEPLHLAEGANARTPCALPAYKVKKSNGKRTCPTPTQYSAADDACVAPEPTLAGHLQHDACEKYEPLDSVTLSKMGFPKCYGNMQWFTGNMYSAAHADWINVRGYDFDDELGCEAQMYLSYTGVCPPVEGTQLSKALGPCQEDAIAGEEKTIVNTEWVLECEKDGSYKVQQCPVDQFGSGTGDEDCYCVDNATGANVGPVPASGQCPQRPCEIHNNRVKGKQDPQNPGIIPGCDDFEIIHGYCHSMTCSDDGMFKKEQCMSSGCFCVDPNTGERIPGTNVLASKGDTLDCDEKPCFLEVSRLQLKNGNNGNNLHFPTCHTDGFYNVEQCDFQKGECWCVNAVTNYECPGTRQEGAITNNGGDCEEVASSDACRDPENPDAKKPTPAPGGQPSQGGRTPSGIPSHKPSGGNTPSGKPSGGNTPSGDHTTDSGATSDPDSPSAATGGATGDNPSATTAKNPTDQQPAKRTGEEEGKSSGSDSGPSGGTIAGIIITILILLGAAGGGYWYWKQKQDPLGLSTPWFSSNKGTLNVGDWAKLDDEHAEMHSKTLGEAL